MGMRVTIAGGGTAGHVYPGLSLADALRSRSGYEVSFVGTARGLENRVVPQAGYPLDLITALPMSRKVSLGSLRAPLAAGRAVMAARELLRAQGAQMVVGMGGYVSLPAIVAARLLGLPALLHEQNAIPGLANRIGARFTPHVAVTFESSAAFFPRRCRVRVTGNPVRAGIAELDRAAVRAEALRTLDLEDRRRTLLVFGGSQGARRLNEALIRATGLWRQPRSLQIVHVCGAANLESVGRDWQEAVPGARGLSVRWFGYVDRMDLAYSAADLVVSRSGATTVSEVSAVGLPAILVPYPFATANHQEANARALESVGAARVLADSEVDADRLVEEVERVLGDEALLASMSVASRAWGRPHAAEALAGYVEEIAFAGGRQEG